LDKITYISNAGVLLEISTKKIMIDGLCNSKIPLFKNTPDEIRKQILNGSTPFDNIDALLFTHNHSDHFDSESAKQFLENKTSACIISTNEVIHELRKIYSNIENNRLIELNTLTGSIENIQINGINIQSIAMHHDGREYEDVHNLAYLIEVEGKKILHVGDAKPVRENFINANLIQQNIDLLIVPFPYIGLPSAREVIELYIKPKKIAVVHLPNKELDANGWINATMRSYKRVEKEFIETMFFDSIGDYINI
jgi:L-ascorbate metabolism protein UlaG (beta-lactamase superfamily)